MLERRGGAGRLAERQLRGQRQQPVRQYRLRCVRHVGAGGSLDAGGVSLATSRLGTYSETIVLTPTDSNADGFSEVMAAQTVTVTGTVVPTGVAQGDVHIVTYDGLHYDFQADGSYRADPLDGAGRQLPDPDRRPRRTRRTMRSATRRKPRRRSAPMW